MPDTKRTASGVLGGLAGLVGLSAVAGVLIAATVTPAVALTGTAAERAITMFDNLPSVLEIDELMLPSNFLVKDQATGEYTVLTSFLEQDRVQVEFDQIASVAYDAVLSSEDPRYFEHGGVDLIGTTRALLSNASGSTETQGGSTISQQYVKNVLIQKCEQSAEIEYETDENGEVVVDEATGSAVVKVSRDEALQKCWSDATTAEGSEGYTRKLQEMRYAIALEQKYSKNEILLGYLNIANFGGITYGIEAAARHYFSVSAAELSVAQAATLAGMVQNPNNYRIDKPEGSIYGDDGTTFNKAPDGVIDEGADLSALDALVESGEITEEQKLAAADGYTSTKVRQLYVLTRMLDDGKITREQYVEAAVWPITPTITDPKTGCAAAGEAAYFCQYVKDVILNDPAFGETEEDRENALLRGGLNVYTTLDWRVQTPAEQAITEYTPSAIEMPTATNYSTGRFGATTTSVEVGTGRILSIAQNTTFSEDASLASDPNYSSLVFAGDSTYGNSTGFNAGSTFKLFTLIDWLEKGHSVNETLNGTLRVFKKMTNSCTGDWYNTSNTLVNNFNSDRGRTGTPLQFTAASLNTGFFAMAEKLDLCDIANAAAKMGVTNDDGTAITMDSLNSIIGTAAVSPLAMASAYATVASGGTYCEPQAIERVTDSEGNELAKPERTCSQVLDPAVAGTAAYALEGVMTSGGTGNQGNPYDGTALIGKTGTHESIQTWLIESSTKVATATWVGNVEGGGDVFNTWYNDRQLSSVRYGITEWVQAAANAAFGGDEFPGPSSELTKRVTIELPNVVGMSVDEATSTLEARGFSVQVGVAVDSDQAEGLVATQSPSAGQVASGTSVTISPSNGQGMSVPDVSGQSLDDAVRSLRSAGFGNVSNGTCTTDASAVQPRSTGTSPAAGSVVNRNTAIAVNYASAVCGGGSGNNNDDDD